MEAFFIGNKKRKGGKFWRTPTLPYHNRTNVLKKMSDDNIFSFRSQETFQPWHSLSVGKASILSNLPY